MNSERIPDNNSDLSAEYQKFKEGKSISHTLGVIGGSSEEDLSSQKNLLIEGCKLIQTKIGNFGIISGGTRKGVPDLALDIGRELGIPTIGVFPQEKAKYVASEKIDFAIPVPSQLLSQVTWGIETSTLVSIPDVFILIGGEWGTLTEVSMIMKRNNSLVRHGIPPVPLISLAGSGKLADSLEQIIQIFPTSPGSHFRVDNSNRLAEIVIKYLVERR
ncbi:hypothetical protein HZB69_01030 [Candidatus Amesbacteria bacterium]|nr:hypothetical protein [Candidatus Amesbacteria bacterium]